MLSFKEYLIEATEFKKLEKNKQDLDDGEREEVMKSNAVWHKGKNGKASPAVWKSVSKDGKNTYITNTHRAYRVATTLKGAIKEYHDFIKGTA